MILGVDCGNVILEQMNGTPVPGAISALARVAQSGAVAPEEIWIVSKCGPRVQALTCKWLNDLDFWSETGIPKGNIRFCLKYYEKAPICKELGITHFIDDRPKVLDCLVTVGTCYAFNPMPESLCDYQRETPLVIVNSWDELLVYLLQ